MDSKKNIFLVQDREVYFYRWENQCVQPMKMNWCGKGMRKISDLLKVRIPRLAIDKKIFSGKKVIFTDSAFHVGIYKSCKKVYDQKNLCLYYMNLIDERTKDFMSYFDKENIYTFDFNDAKKFGIHFKHTPYSDKTNFCNQDLTYDTIFLGRSKNRMDNIESIFSSLNEDGIKAKFMVLNTRNDEMRIEEYLDYQEYLQMLSRSRTITEICKADQAGCSLRMLESLFFKKKLITNNIRVYEDPYYSKRNVFVWNHDERNIRQFIAEDYESDQEISDLVFETWIEQF